MPSWFHTMIIATVLAATFAVGLASASVYFGIDRVAPRADRLPVIADAAGYVTIETRHDGVSVLQRIQIK